MELYNLWRRESPFYNACGFMNCKLACFWIPKESFTEGQITKLHVTHVNRLCSEFVDEFRDLWIIRIWVKKLEWQIIKTNVIICEHSYLSTIQFILVECLRGQRVFFIRTMEKHVLFSLAKQKLSVCMTVMYN